MAGFTSHAVGDYLVGNGISNKEMRTLMASGASALAVEAVGGDGGRIALQAALVHLYNAEWSEINKNKYIISNKRVVENLEWLQEGLIQEGYPDVKVLVTGGDSHWDDILEVSVSETNSSIILDRLENSAHHVSNGNRAVDLRRTPGITDEAFRNVVKEYTDFYYEPGRQPRNHYHDGHWHLRLPWQ